MLVLHLPLTGNVHNQGLLDEEVEIQQNLVWSDVGKLGKCIQFNGNTNQILSFANVPKKTNNFTWACWVKQSNRTSTTYNSTKQYVLSNGRDCGAIGFNIFIHDGILTIHMGSGANDGSMTSTTNSRIQIQELSLNTWYHICCAVNDNNVMVYIDGTLIKILPLIEINFRSDRESYFTIGKMAYGHYYTTSYFPFDGYVQDVRVYDTCLSPRQVKEISKGLVCHYPLGEIDGKIGGRNLLVKTNQGKTKWTNAHADGSYSCESVNWNGINVVKMSCATPTTSWKMFTFNGLLENFDKLEPSAIYTLSYDVIGNIKVGFSNLWDSDATHSIVALAQETVIKKTYGSHYIVNITLKDALNKSKQLVYFRNDLKAGESVIIANLKLEKGNKATAYTPCPTDDPVMYDNVIYDTSGYCNNGSVSGDILWDTNTPRYNGAYDFNGTGYIYNDNLNLTTTAFTISFWIKIPSAITHQHFDFATFNSWTSEGVGIYWDTSGQKSSSGGIFGKDSNGDKIHVGVQCRGKLNEWTHFAITWDGTNVYRYSNGIKFSESDFNAVSVYHPRLWLGNSTFGDRTLENSESCMSDFRFYVTALSDSDILELYQSSASVDNNGNLMLAGEVIEE